MIYKKPKDITYTEMAMYIDEHVYEENSNDELIFEYIYHLAMMLAYKQHYFSKYEYYEDFAVFAATSVFMRLKNKKQYELDSSGRPKMTKIKSVLNYLKVVLYPKKVDFEQNYYSQLISSPDVPDEKTHFALDTLMSQTVDDLNIAQFNLCLNDVANTCKRTIRDIPFKKNKANWNNIYLSCLLTFISNLTLSEKNKERIKLLGKTFFLRPDILESMYKEESIDVILYHIDSHLKDYIKVLTNKMKHTLAKDLSLSLHEYISSDGNVKNILLAQIDGTDEI